MSHTFESKAAWEAGRDRLQAAIRDVPDFPKPGILFRDITPILGDASLLALSVDLMAHRIEGKVDAIVGIESRGFLFGIPLAMRLDVGFVPVRKPGKLPAETREVRYALEYGEDALQMHTDALRSGQRALVVDDLLATGGTARATCDLVEACGATVAGCSFLIELAGLSGRARLGDIPATTVITY